MIGHFQVGKLALQQLGVIVGPDGYPLAGPVTGDQEAVLTAPCDLALARDKKISEHNDILADRRPQLYRAVAG